MLSFAGSVSQMLFLCPVSISRSYVMHTACRMYSGCNEGDCRVRSGTDPSVGVILITCVFHEIQTVACDVSIL